MIHHRQKPAAQVWQRSRHTFDSSLMGPHFEGICRQWARWYADPGTYGSRYVGRVASGTVSDPAAQKTLEVDVAAFGQDEEGRDTLLALGEAKWQETITASHLKKLEHIRGLLLARGEPGADNARLLFFSGSGFSDAIVERAGEDPTIQLIGLDRLYYGS